MFFKFYCSYCQNDFAVVIDLERDGGYEVVCPCEKIHLREVINGQFEFGYEIHLPGIKYTQIKGKYITQNEFEIERKKYKRSWSDR
jgi:hypothetical protein